MRLSHQIVMASTNSNKLREFRSLLTAYPGIKLVSAESVIRNPEKIGFAEKYDSYIENASAKARLANLASHYPALADDSGLEIEALGGKPGVLSQRFAQLKGYPSKASQDQANIDLVLSELSKANQAGNTSRKARFVATLVLIIEGISIHATGVLEGTIADEPKGEMGFGYDPIFIPKGSAHTLAEMAETAKNSISHRAKALHELMAQVRARGIAFVKP